MELTRQEEDLHHSRNTLDLSSHGLTYLSPSSPLVTRSFGVSTIRRLVIADNSLSVVPNLIAQFINLEELDISRNSISWISGEIGQLTKLKILIARNNRLSTLPKELESSRSLEILNLSGNQFTSIPKEIFGLVKLQELYLGGNQISSIADGISRLEGLRVLYLGGNLLSSIPGSLGSLRNLQALILCDNKLEHIPPKLADLKKLRSLSLHKNNLKTLPMEIVKLMHLQELSLRDNPLVNKFARDYDFNPPSLQELSGRSIKLLKIPYRAGVLPSSLVSYLDSAQSCVNPKCKGVYFDSRVRCLKFVDFCGQYRLPLEQYLCSRHSISCDVDCNNHSVPASKIQKLLLPR